MDMARDNACYEEQAIYYSVHANASNLDVC